MKLAMLNTVDQSGRPLEIVSAKLVNTDEEGEKWFCENKPEDGTQVDYTLWTLIDILKR